MRTIVKVIAWIWIIWSGGGTIYGAVASLGEPVKALLLLLFGAILIAPGVLALILAKERKTRTMPKINVGEQVRTVASLENTDVPLEGTNGVVQDFGGTGFHGKVPNNEGKLEWTESTPYSYLVDFGPGIGAKWVLEDFLEVIEQ